MAQEQQEKAKTPVGESAGVEELISRLRDEGIAEGRGQADALVAAAQKEAADIIAAAKQEADAASVKAKEEAEKLKAAGEDAVRLAMRDTILALEGDLLKDFAERLRHMVKGVLADPAFLQRLILEVAGRAASATTGKSAEILLPAELVSLDDLRRKPEEAKPGTLTHFVLSMGGSALRDGMSFGITEEGEAGIRVRLVEEDVQIDLTDKAMTGLLLQHMLPRFRALLRGAVVVESGPGEQAKNDQPESKGTA